jgi:hypothetical protein
MENNNIDKLFQDAASKTSFEFQEDYWTEFEKMLPAKKKGFPFFWVFSGILVLGTSVGAFYFLNQDQDNTLAQKELTHFNRNEINPVSSESENLNNKILNKKEANHPTDQASLKPEESSILMKKSPKVVESKNKSNDLYKLANKTNENSNKSDNINTKNNHILLKPMEEFSLNSIEAQLGTNRMEVLELASNPFTLFGLNSPTLQTNAYSYTVPTKWNLYMDLGIGIGQSPIQDNTYGSNFTKSVNFGIGITYKPSFWSFSAGLDFSSTQFKNLLIRERVKVYGFGATNFDNELVYRSIYQISLPVQLAYQTNNHIFTLTLNTSYLATTKMEYQSTSNNEIIVENTMYGYNKGLKPWTFRPTIGYQHHLSPQWLIGTNLSINSNSFIEPEIFEGKQNSFSLNGQFFIRKTFKL